MAEKNAAPPHPPSSSATLHWNFTEEKMADRRTPERVCAAEEREKEGGQWVGGWMDRWMDGEGEEDEEEEEVLVALVSVSRSGWGGYAYL